MNMTEQTAIRWDLDADGIVTLTMDDPNQSANTMNELYQESMEAHRGAAPGRGSRATSKGVDPHLREEDLLRRRRPQDA
jgi:hypothetical protein